MNDREAEITYYPEVPPSDTTPVASAGRDEFGGLVPGRRSGPDRVSQTVLVSTTESAVDPEVLDNSPAYLDFSLRAIGQGKLMLSGLPGQTEPIFFGRDESGKWKNPGLTTEAGLPLVGTDPRTCIITPDRLEKIVNATRGSDGVQHQVCSLEQLPDRVAEDTDYTVALLVAEGEDAASEHIDDQSQHSSRVRLFLGPSDVFPEELIDAMQQAVGIQKQGEMHHGIGGTAEDSLVGAWFTNMYLKFRLMGMEDTDDAVRHLVEMYRIAAGHLDAEERIRQKAAQMEQKVQMEGPSDTTNDVRGVIQFPGPQTSQTPQDLRRAA